MNLKISPYLLCFAASSCNAFSPPQRLNAYQSMSLYSQNNDADTVSSRRNFLNKAALTAATSIAISSSPAASHASGGATAGKYTTIPIAKRRYYGRVQEAVHEFLLMAPAVIKGDMTDPIVQVMPTVYTLNCLVFLQPLTTLVC